jgi:Zinc knuckle
MAAVTDRGEGFLIRLSSRTALERLMMRNGATLIGGSVVRITPHEVKLSLDDLFRSVENELRCQERSDSYGRSWGGPSESTPTTVQEVRSSEVRPKAPEAPPVESGETPGKGSTSSSGGVGKGKSKGGRSPSPGTDGSQRGSFEGYMFPRGKGRGKDGAPSSPKGGPRGDYREGRYVTPYRSSRDRSATPVRARSPSKEHPCVICGEADHWVRDCPHRAKQLCYSCRDVGHIAKFCPKGEGAKRAGTPPRKGSA